MAGSTFMGEMAMTDDNIYKAQCQVMKDLVDSYDLCIDSSLLGIEGTAQFIVEFITRRLAQP